MSLKIKVIIKNFRKKNKIKMKIFSIILVLFVASSVSVANIDEQMKESAEETRLLPLMKAIVSDPEFVSLSYDDQVGILLAINDMFGNQFTKN